MTKFEKYVDEVETMISEFTSKIPAKELHEIEKSIEDSDAGSGKLWLEDFPAFQPHHPPVSQSVD